MIWLCDERNTVDPTPIYGPELYILDFIEKKKIKMQHAVRSVPTVVCSNKHIRWVDSKTKKKLLLDSCVEINEIIRYKCDNYETHKQMRWNQNYCGRRSINKKIMSRNRWFDVIGDRSTIASNWITLVCAFVLCFIFLMRWLVPRAYAAECRSPIRFKRAEKPEYQKV